jgi:hypothetical protein
LPDSRHDLTIYGGHGWLTGIGTLWEECQGALEVVSETVNKTETIPPDPLASYIDELTDVHRALVEDRLKGL